MTFDWIDDPRAPRSGGFKEFHHLTACGRSANGPAETELHVKLKQTCTPVLNQVDWPDVLRGELGLR